MEIGLWPWERQQEDFMMEARIPKETNRARLKLALSRHWLTNVECNHEDKTDTARCWCSVWTGKPQPTVAMAVNEWVEHVIEELDRLEMKDNT